MDIVSAKRELYKKLSTNEEVIGAGIKGSGKAEYIVIFVKDLTDQIAAVIPNTFKGVKVKTEQQKTAKPM